MGGSSKPWGKLQRGQGKCAKRLFLRYCAYVGLGGPKAEWQLPRASKGQPLSFDLGVGAARPAWPEMRGLAEMRRRAFSGCPLPIRQHADLRPRHLPRNTPAKTKKWSSECAGRTFLSEEQVISQDRPRIEM